MIDEKKMYTGNEMQWSNASKLLVKIEKPLIDGAKEYLRFEKYENVDKSIGKWKIPIENDSNIRI